MTRLRNHLGIVVTLLSLCMVDDSSAQSFDSPASRLRPIGSPSAVDQYRGADLGVRYRETEYRQNGFGQSGQVRQTALLQQMELPNNFGTPPAATVPAPVPQVTTQQLAPPGTRTLPMNPSAAVPGTLQPVPVVQQAPIASPSDQAPIPAPQLNDGFATIDNCHCVSAPSTYVASVGPCGGCAPVSYQGPATYVAPPPQIAAPAFVPAAVPTTVPSGRAAGIPHGALISFGQEAYPVQVGQGLFGQPVAYVPGQRFRNWIRYIFP